MSWNTPTDQDVLEEFTPAEQTSLQAIQGGNTQLDSIITKTVNAARGSIQAGGNELDVAGTIPDQIFPHVIAIIRWRWLVSFPKLKMLQTDERRDAYRDGEKMLTAIASGSPKVERPVNAIATTGDLVQFPAVGYRPKRFGHREEDGI